MVLTFKGTDTENLNNGSNALSTRDLVVLTERQS